MDCGKQFARCYGCFPADLTKEVEQEITEQTEGFNPLLPPFAPVEILVKLLFGHLVKSSVRSDVDGSRIRM